MFKINSDFAHLYNMGSNCCENISYENLKRESCLWSLSSFFESCIKLRPLTYVRVRVLWQLCLYLALHPTVPGLASLTWLPGHVSGLNCH